MVAVSCPYCLALLAEMRSAAMEAGAISEDARAQVRAGGLPEAHAREWWLDARRRWLDASTDLTNHIATHLVNPTCFGQENGFPHEAY
jgi:hypothetical protein